MLIPRIRGLLSVRPHNKASMDSTLLTGIIGAAATIGAVVLGWYLQKPKAESPKSPSPASPEEDAPKAYARRYLEYPSHYRFIKALPKLRAVVQENAREGWDTGVTADMREASYDVIDFLQYAWLRLAQFYPDNHWGPKTAEEYISSYIQDRFSFHWSKHEPSGPGTGGTIVGVLTGGDVIADLEGLIVDTVAALLGYKDDFDLDQWRKEWAGKAS